MSLTLPSPRRLAFLAAALLSACAAAEGGPGEAASRLPEQPLRGLSRRPLRDVRIRHAHGGRRLLAALRADPDQPEVIQRAFIATLLDGRPEAVRLARRLPDNPSPPCCSPGPMPRPGAGTAPSSASGPCRARARRNCCSRCCWPGRCTARARPMPRSRCCGRCRKAGGCARCYALHAALICDLAGRTREAERFVRIAIGDNSPPTLRLVQIAAGILARGGKRGRGAAPARPLARGQDDLALATGERRSAS
jgi:hypothetical protein